MRRPNAEAGRCGDPSCGADRDLLNQDSSRLQKKELERRPTLFEAAMDGVVSTRVYQG